MIGSSPVLVTLLWILRKWVCTFFFFFPFPFPRNPPTVAVHLVLRNTRCSVLCSAPVDFATDKTLIQPAGAYLHLTSLSPLADGQRRAAVATFADGLYKTYYSHLCSITNEMDRYRQALLVFHACEMITASVWKHGLWCGCEGTLSCSHTRTSIHVAAGLLRSVKGQQVDWFGAERVSGWTRYLRGNLEESRTVAS